MIGIEFAIPPKDRFKHCDQQLENLSKDARPLAFHLAYHVSHFEPSKCQTWPGCVFPSFKWVGAESDGGYRILIQRPTFAQKMF